MPKIDWQVDVPDDKAFRKVQSVVKVQSQLYKEVLDKVQARRGKQCAVAGRGYLRNLRVGGFVLVVRLRSSSSTPKLLMTWTGPWCVVVAQRPHVYGVENTVSVYRDVHVARNRFYANAAVAITAELK